MATLLLKLLLTPLLIGLASLAGRRWGPAVGGWLVGLPLTSAPVAVVLTAEHGTDFAAAAALGILGGVASQAVFAVAYACVAELRGMWATLLVSLVAFAACTVVLWRAPLPLVGMCAVAVIVLVAALAVLVRAAPSLAAPVAVPLPRWDLPARVVLATAFVVLVTAVAGALGPRLSGLITPFPIYAAVLTLFAHRLLGPSAAVATLRGLVLGLFAFVAFFVVLAMALPRIGWAAFAVAALAALAVQGLSFRGVRASGVAISR
jgi:hypothetical protein